MPVCCFVDVHVAPRQIVKLGFMTKCFSLKVKGPVCRLYINLRRLDIAKQE